jgi:hypothetical protein
VRVAHRQRIGQHDQDRDRTQRGSDTGHGSWNEGTTIQQGDLGATSVFLDWNQSSRQAPTSQHTDEGGTGSLGAGDRDEEEREDQGCHRCHELRVRLGGSTDPDEGQESDSEDITETLCDEWGSSVTQADTTLCVLFGEAGGEDRATRKGTRGLSSQIAGDASAEAKGKLCCPEIPGPTDGFDCLVRAEHEQESEYHAGRQAFEGTGNHLRVPKGPGDEAENSSDDEDKHPSAHRGPADHERTSPGDAVWTCVVRPGPQDWIRRKSTIVPVPGTGDSPLSISAVQGSEQVLLVTVHVSSCYGYWTAAISATMRPRVISSG